MHRFRRETTIDRIDVCRYVVQPQDGGLDMRIYDRDLTGAGAAESGRAQETQKTDHGETSALSGSGSVAGDRVELSSGLASVSRALAAYSSDRTGKVQQLT